MARTGGRDERPRSKPRLTAAPTPVTPTFFKTPAQFRAWLARHHASVPELLLGYYKTGSGKGGITYSESLDEALCFGWIDGVRRRFDDDSYTVRFSPRRPKSVWSAVNINRVAALSKAGRMDPAGLKVFAERDLKRSGLYSYEQRKTFRLDPALQRRLEASVSARQFFESQAPWYQRTVIFWIMSAKKEETRWKRLEQLIADSERGRRLGLLPSEQSQRPSSSSRASRSRPT